VPAQHPPDLVEVEREVLAALARDDSGVRDLGDVGVQGVGRLEGGHRTARAPVGEAQGLEDLVGAVGHEHLRRRDAVVGGDGLAQRGGVAVGVAVPVEAGELGLEGLPEARRGRLGGLVGVQADVDVDLG
jgi:hypothetical protein